MTHPIFKDPPSTDMTEAQERQRVLDEQIAAFLNKDGEIQALDNQSRPAECTPWRSQSINPMKPAPAAEPVKAKRSKPAVKAPADPAREAVIATIAVPKPKVIDIASELRELRKQAADAQRRLNRIAGNSEVSR